METREGLAWDIDRAAGDLAAVLVGCTDVEAGIRCGGDSRTVLAIANHVAEWLHLLAEVVPDLTRGRGDRLQDDVVDEIDAAFAKAAANRSLTETRSRLIEAARRLRLACDALEEKDLSVVVQSDEPDVTVGSLLRRWGCDHVSEHTAMIRAGLLAADALASDSP